MCELILLSRNGNERKHSYLVSPNLVTYRSEWLCLFNFIAGLSFSKFTSTIKRMLPQTFITELLWHTILIPVSTLSPICSSDILIDFPFSRVSLAVPGKQSPHDWQRWWPATPGFHSVPHLQSHALQTSLPSLPDAYNATFAALTIITASLSYRDSYHHTRILWYLVPYERMHNSNMSETV